MELSLNIKTIYIIPLKKIIVTQAKNNFGNHKIMLRLHYWKMSLTDVDT